MTSSSRDAVRSAATRRAPFIARRATTATKMAGGTGHHDHSIGQWQAHGLGTKLLGRLDIVTQIAGQLDEEVGRSLSDHRARREDRPAPAASKAS